MEASISPSWTAGGQEAYTPEIGWALSDGHDRGEDPSWDVSEANALYDLLEQKVVPEFYARNEQGLPGLSWIARIRESMARLTPRFSTYRSVREYTETYYCSRRHQPTIPASLTMARSGYNLSNGANSLSQKWSAVRFTDVNIKTDGGQHLFEARVRLDGLDPESVQVELVCAFPMARRFGRP